MGFVDNNLQNVIVGRRKAQISMELMLTSTTMSRKQEMLARRIL